MAALGSWAGRGLDARSTRLVQVTRMGQGAARANGARDQVQADPTRAAVLRPTMATQPHPCTLTLIQASNRPVPYTATARVGA